MKVSGFTFVRNGIKFDYPVVEAIQSILPVCDEFVVAVGNSEDDTLELIHSIPSPKIKILETVWDDSLREGGRVLAVETNKAFAAVSPDSDWAFYIQADEVFHEDDLPKIVEAMKKWKDDKRVEGFVFNHINFFGSYDYVADSHKWHKKEVRIIRNDKTISSYKDAMSFRKNGKKLRVKYVNATIYHYGWVKHPLVQKEKRIAFNKMWHDDSWIETSEEILNEFDYSEKIDVLSRFEGTHPVVMHPRIKRMNWKFSFDPSKRIRPSLRIRLINLIYKLTGWHIGEFKNYKLI